MFSIPFYPYFMEVFISLSSALKRTGAGGRAKNKTLKS